MMRFGDTFRCHQIWFPGISMLVGGSEDSIATICQSFSSSTSSSTTEDPTRASIPFDVDRTDFGDG